MTEPPQELHQAAPTLAELRKLPAEVKDRLFLAKLARMSRNDANALHKGNITSFGDPYQVAKGYPPQEQPEVIEHLFGGPWARLVHEGYLVQLNNQGFHKVSVEGHDYLNQPVSPPDVAPAARAPRSPLPDRIAGIRRGFISYSWDSEEHKLWVLALAERLRDDGIQIILDRWHLKLGQNKNYFMERAVGDSDFVVVICTPTYATKADQRQGGVGYEATIITSELADDLLTDKFIPVVREGTFKTAVPNTSNRISAWTWVAIPMTKKPTQSFSAVKGRPDLCSADRTQARYVASARPREHNRCHTLRSDPDSAEAQSRGLGSIRQAWTGQRVDLGHHSNLGSGPVQLRNCQRY